MIKAIGIASLVVTMACQLDGAHYVGTEDAGAGEPGDLSAGEHSGTRIKIKSAVYSETVRYKLGLYDTQLGVECGAVPWTDGVLYCTPEAIDVVFADGQCSAPLGAFTPDLCDGARPAPSYIRSLRFASGATGKIERMYRRGARTTTPYYYLNGAECLGPIDPPPEAQVYTLAGEVSRSELVRMTDGLLDAGPLSRHVQRGTDGLVTATRGLLHDNTNDADCFLTYSRDMAMATQCRPFPIAIADVYGDAQCTVHEVTAYSETPRFAVVPASEPSGESSFSKIGAAVAAAPLYQRDAGGVCTAATPQPNATYYALGPAITVQRLARLPGTVLGQRVQPMTVVAGAQQFLDYDTYDTTLGTECDTQIWNGASARCVPQGVGAAQVFSDASCQQAISVALAPGAGAGGALPAPPAYVAVHQGGVCGADEIHHVGTQYTGPLYALNGVTCAQIPPSDLGASYRVGAVVPTDSFAAATVQIDP